MSCVSIAIIGFKRSTWWGPSKSAFEDLTINEKRLAAFSGISFLAGILIFIIGVIIKLL